MSRGAAAAAGLLALLLAGAPPAAGQPWTGERLCAPTLPAGAEFGSAVAVGDDGTIAVGDYRHDVVVLFRRDAAGRCEQTAAISGPGPGSWFGFDLAIDGSRLLVGAPRSGGTGAAYLVELRDGRAAGAPRQVSGLTPRPGPGDEAGSAVAIDGRILAIGARGADDRRGRVYAGGEGELAPVLLASSLAPGAELGQSVALHGRTLVMGAPFPFRGSGSPGAAYVVELSADGSPGAPASPLLAGGLEPEAAFGYTVAVAGGRILAGAPLADRNGVDGGAVFDFRPQGTGWARGTELRLPGRGGDQLGVAVALDGGTALVGARHADGTRGAAYLVGASGGTQTLRPRETVPAGAQLGFSVAIRGDVAVVGAFRENGAGAAYRFDALVTVVPVTVELATAASSVPESAGTISLQVVVHGPSGGLSVPVTVDLEVLEGTAGEGEDFRLLDPGPYVIPAGTRPDVPFPLAEVRIQPDALVEGPETFRVRLSARPPAVTGAQSVHEVTIHDSLLVVPAGPLETSEAGGSAPLAVRLAVQPTANVVVSLSTGDPGEGIVSPVRLTFTPESWQRVRTVRVAGRDDALCDGSQAYVINATTTSADPRYAGLSQSIPAANADDERACLSAAKSVCTDDGGTVVYTISLANPVAGGPDTPAQLRDVLPPEVSVVTAGADGGTATADPVANSVRWTGPVPAAGAAVTITIVAALDVPPGREVRNHADVSYVRDGRGNVETVRTDEVVFVAGDVLPCP